MAILPAGVLNRAPVRALRNATSIARVLATPGLDTEEKRACWRFFRDAWGYRRLVASLPRSGFHYATLVLTVALDLARGGDGEYAYFRDTWALRGCHQYRPLDWRFPLDRIDYDEGYPEPLILHTHMPYYQVPCRRVDAMRTVLMIRNPWDSLESQLFREGYGRDRQDAFIEDGFVDKAIAFLEAWGARAAVSELVHVVRYEDLMRAPAEALSAMADHWQLDIDRPTLAEALARTTRDEMRRRIPTDRAEANPRVSFRDDGPAFSERNRQRIAAMLSRGLHHRFGYTDI